MSPRVRTPGWSRLLPIAGVLLVTLFVGGCRGSLSSQVVTDLENGIAAAQVTAGGFNDLASLTRQAQVQVPESLTTALRQADEAARSGGSLSDEHELLVARGEQWAAYAVAVNDAFGLVSGVEVQLAKDAYRLAQGRLYNNARSSAGFQDDLAALEQRVLKGLWCDALRFGLDEAVEQQAAAQPAAYEYVGDNAASVAAYMRHNLTGWTNVEGAVDIAGLASDSIKQSNKYLAGAFDVIEAPTGTLAVANVAYFRGCVTIGAR
jgi:hypothetical protein